MLVGVAANPGIQPSPLFLQNTVAPEGTHAGFLQVYGPGGVHTTALTTTISGLVPLSQYEVTFFENARDATNAVVDASTLVNGVPVVLPHGVSHTSAFGSVTSLPFTATSPTESLQFLNQLLPADTNTDATWLVDNIQIVSVPEPASLGLLGAAGLLGLARRRRA